MVRHTNQKKHSTEHRHHRRKGVVLATKLLLQALNRALNAPTRLFKVLLVGYHQQWLRMAPWEKWCRQTARSGDELALSRQHPASSVTLMPGVSINTMNF